MTNPNNPPIFALFDLDHTLLATDSDVQWGIFLVENGLVDKDFYAEQNLKFYAEYQAGTLDIHEYVRFVTTALRQFPMPTLLAWRAQYLESHIIPNIAAQTASVLAWHRARGHEIIMITATNRFVVAPIAAHLDITQVLATELVQNADGEYTGDILGVPCFQGGKVTKLQQFLTEQHGISADTMQNVLNKSYFYSDSINDLPLLSQVGKPVVVNGDAKLQAIAQDKNWANVSFRTENFDFLIDPWREYA